MCLYPTLIRNRKYMPNKTNKGKAPIANDKRKLWVPIGCGVCSECRKKKGNEWRIRLAEELKQHPVAKFVTLTYSTDALEDLSMELIKRDIEPTENEIIKLSVRWFLERYRKKHGKSIKHWFISELGGELGRIHLHGIIFEGILNDELKELWDYGFTDTGKYVNQRTINYIVKYMMKGQDEDYVPIIRCSKGLGKTYLNRQAKINKYNEEQTIEEMRLPNGRKIGMPVYYRNKIYDENQREELWIRKLDNGIRWINGIKIRIKDHSVEEIEEMLKHAQRMDRELGYKAPKQKDDHMTNYKQILESMIGSVGGVQNENTPPP